MKKFLFILIIIVLLFLATIIIYISIFKDQDEENTDNLTTQLQSQSQNDSALLEAATSTKEDTVLNIIRVSNNSDLDAPYDIDTEAGKVKRIFNGRRINISIIGVDSRLGSSYKHADANHVLSLLLDEGKIEITSIPRDTPCDAKQEDSTQNKLTVLYPALGRNAYLKEVAKIAELDQIHYWIELNFSQARGILELLGFKNSGTTLQMLRSRTVIADNDYQRVYNQAQFIKQVILKHFDKMTGFFAPILIRGGLTIVNSNITYSIAENLLKQLKNSGFPKNPDDIIIRIRPPIKIKYKIYDYFDETTLKLLTQKIENHSSHSATFTIDQNYIIRKLEYALLKAEKDTNSPNKIIYNLKTLFDQKAWLQVEDLNKREQIRDKFYNLIYNAYLKKNQQSQADEIKKQFEAEKKLFETPIFQ